jgi:cation transport ATPase
LTDSSRLAIQDLHYAPEAEQAESLAALYALELLSAHPIADEIRKYIGVQTEYPEIQNFQDLGKAAQGSYWQDGQEHTVLAGSVKYLRENNLLDTAFNLDDEAVALLIDGQLRLYFFYAETLREDAAETILALQQTGKRIVIASGDTAKRVNAALELLNAELQEIGAEPISAVHADMRPADKTALIKSLQTDGGRRHYVAMVGDGNNDSGALALSDFGISWNAKGLARNAAHALVTDGSRLQKIADIFVLSKRYSRNMVQNILVSTLGNMLIIAGVLSGYTGVLLGKLGGSFLRSMDMFISMIAHESLSILTGVNAARPGKSGKARLNRRPNAERHKVLQP